MRDVKSARRVVGSIATMTMRNMHGASDTHGTCITHRAICIATTLNQESRRLAVKWWIDTFILFLQFLFFLVIGGLFLIAAVVAPGFVAKHGGKVLDWMGFE